MKSFLVKPMPPKKNAEAVVKKNIPDIDSLNVVWTIIKNEENRYFPLFFGNSALDAGIHFKFNVVAF